MESFLIASAWALWLGVLTSIHPCPLATNVAAVTYLASRGGLRRVLLGGMTYALGRVLAYVGVSVLVISGMLAVPAVARFLQVWLNKLLGPVLILVGMFLVELIRLRRSAPDRTGGIPRSAQGGGVLGSALLGIVFAMSFCPASAAMFFGGLIPLSFKHNSRLVLPLLYGLGTGLPVIMLAGFLRFGAESMGTALARLKTVERLARLATGVLFIGVGVYYVLAYVFEVV